MVLQLVSLVNRRLLGIYLAVNNCLLNPHRNEPALVCAGTSFSAAWVWRPTLQPVRRPALQPGCSPANNSEFCLAQPYPRTYSGVRRSMGGSLAR